MSQKNFVKASIVEAINNGLTEDAIIEFAVAKVKSGLMDGTCPHKSGQLEEKKAQSYATAVVGNYIKRDTDLNGGVKYVPETKRGPIVKDERLKDLKTAIASLKANNADMTLIGQVEEAYEARKAEVDAMKTQSKVPSLEETMEMLAKLGIEG